MRRRLCCTGPKKSRVGGKAEAEAEGYFLRLFCVESAVVDIDPAAERRAVLERGCSFNAEEEASAGIAGAEVFVGVDLGERDEIGDFK